MSMFSLKKGAETTAWKDESSADGSLRPMVTVIAKGVIVEGQFSSDGPVQIDGEVKGHIKTTGSFVAGSASKIVADISAASASIAGSVVGAVQVSEQLHLHATAKIEGDITCSTIVVDAGAVILGKVTVRPPNPVV